MWAKQIGQTNANVRVCFSDHTSMNEPIFASANSFHLLSVHQRKAFSTFVRDRSFLLALNIPLEKFVQTVVRFFSITLESFSEFTLINVACDSPNKSGIRSPTLIRRSAQINFGQREKEKGTSSSTLLRVISFFILHRRSASNNGAAAAACAN